MFTVLGVSRLPPVSFYRYVIRVPFCARVRPGCPCVSRLPPVSFYPGPVKNAAAFCTYLLDATYDLHMTWADGDAIDTIEFRTTLIPDNLCNVRRCVTILSHNLNVYEYV